MVSADLASRSFVLLHAEWSAGRARAVMDGRTATHVVVRRREGDTDFWYVYPVSIVAAMLEAAPPDAQLRDALNLHETGATPVVDANAPALAAPPLAVVQEGGLVVGFIDRTPGGGDGRGPVRGDGGGPPAEPAAAPHTVEAEFPDATDVGRVEWLLVHLAAGVSGGGGIAVDLPADEAIDILVQARRGFVVEGDDKGTLTVPAAGETMPLSFHLKATEVGPAIVKVLAFHKGQPLGVITLTPTVRESGVAATPGQPAARSVRAARPLASPSPQVPDLSMLIEEQTSNGTKEFVIRLTSPSADLALNYKKFGPIRLAVDAEKFFDSFFADIEALPVDTPEQRSLIEAKMAAKGTYLYSTLFPADLQQQLWDLRDRIGSIVVQSEEPWIPWELCKLQGRRADGGIEEGPFLCEKYTITRWVPEIGFRRPLTLKNLALVVPDDSGLPLAGEERDYVLSLAGQGRKVTRIPANFVELRKALASGEYDGWHFTGHGLARDDDPDRSSIYLAANDPFTPEDLSGEVANAGLARPVVFLNACQVGRGGMSLTGIGGWARRWLGAGAGAFIGAYWSVYDEAAFDFAKAVYARLLAGEAIGDAVREARAAIRPAGDPTWLAYTVFADPLASVGS
jgi:hypothetical protein